MVTRVPAPCAMTKGPVPEMAPLPVPVLRCAVGAMVTVAPGPWKNEIPLIVLVTPKLLLTATVLPDPVKEKSEPVMLAMEPALTLNSSAARQATALVEFNGVLTIHPYLLIAMGLRPGDEAASQLASSFLGP